MRQSSQGDFVGRHGEEVREKVEMASTRDGDNLDSERSAISDARTIVDSSTCTRAS